MTLFSHCRLLAGALCGLVLLASACSDAELPSSTSPHTSAGARFNSADVTESQAVANQLARILASGMRETEVRQQVRNAMRASQFNEHKLVLQDFLSTPSGRRLVEVSAKASGVSADRIDALAFQLPRMDFYVPFREQRLTWTGTPDLVVGATMDQDDAVFTAYTPEGRSVVYDARKGAPSRAVLIFHPEEIKLTRNNPQTATSGSVIQDPGEDRPTGVRVTYGPDGDSTVTVLALEPCAECEGSGGGGSSSTMHALIIWFGDGVGSAEVEYTYWGTDGSKLAVDRYTDLYPNYWYVYNTAVPNRTYIDYISAVETDAFSDDNWGSIQWSQAYTGPNGSTGYPFAAYCETTGDPNTDCTPGTIVNTTDLAFYW